MRRLLNYRWAVLGRVCAVAGLSLACGLLAQNDTSAPPVRYHFGDDARWADPHFDDASWPQAKRAFWPPPQFFSDGFMWVRFQVPVRAELPGPLAIKGSDPQKQLADEIYVNGRQVGGFGKLPPHALLQSLRSTLAPLPDGVVHPGASAEVALRLWYPPNARINGFDTMRFEIEQRRALNAEDAAHIASVRLDNAPTMMLNVVLVLVGLVVLVLWRVTGNRDLLLSGGVVLSYPLYLLSLELVQSRFLLVNTPEYYPMEVLIQLPGMWLTVEFIWRMNGLKGLWLKRTALAMAIIFNTSELIGFLSNRPSKLVALALLVYILSLAAFNLVTIGANLWVVFAKRRNQVIAAAMALIPIGSVLSAFGIWFGSISFFILASLLAAVVLTIALLGKAWKEWRARDALKTEFEAAREVQEALVTPPGEVPGFEIDSAYAPALHVGGDFFLVRPEDDGGALIVVGDVSGKGLRAALVVSAVMGALRTMPPMSPSRILRSLNGALSGQMRGGFVTCCATRIAPDGLVTLANAGHLPPYRDGAEVEIAPGLPLGMDEDSVYEERQFALEAGGKLTFVSDGVVEAQSPSGELFGFERTLQISSWSAQAIAEAARAFGQEDDITVVCMTRVNSGSLSPRAVPAEASTPC